MKPARPIAATACGFACLLLLTGCESPLTGGDPEPAPPVEPTAPPAAPDTPPADESNRVSEGVRRPAGLTDQELSGGWVALFDGRSTFGWGGGHDMGGVVVEASALRPTRRQINTNLSGASFLTPLGFGSFRFQVSRPGGITAEVWLSESSDHDARLLAFAPAPSEAEWLDVNLKWADGVAATEVGPGEPQSIRATAPARLSVGGRTRAVKYRHVRFRPDTVPLDAANFTPVPGNAVKITRENDELRLTGGPGFLRSSKTYADFVLQCEVKLNAPDSNSGLFFRAVDPTEAAPSNGYEVQLQNTLGHGGRTDPDDYEGGFGTGAFFRRQPARYVNADDGEWFHLTLVCVGNRMATWVNGLQVTDFTDDREPHPNPRKGRRDEAGYLLLQAHDAGTDVSFRNIRVQRLNAE